MSFKKLGSGPVLIDNVRTDLSAVSIPPGWWFVIRASHDGPLALTHLAINLTLLLSEPVKTTNGWIAVELKKHPRPGDSISWSVFAGFEVPALAAYLVVDQEPKKLSTKQQLKAGTSWAHHVKLPPKQP